MKKLRVSLFVIVTIALCLTSIIRIGTDAHISNQIYNTTNKSYIAGELLYPPPALICPLKSDKL